jgi:hypothetical protein
MGSVAAVGTHAGTLAKGAVDTVLLASGKLHELAVLPTSRTKLLIVSVSEQTILPDPEAALRES